MTSNPVSRMICKRRSAVSDFGFEEDTFDSPINKGTLIRILGLLRPYYRWVAAFLTAITLVSILDSVFTFLSKQIIDKGITLHDAGMVWRLVGLYGLLTLVQACGVMFFIFLVGILGERVRYDLRKIMFDHLQELPLSYFSQKPVGWIMARVTSDSDRVADLMTWGLLDTTWASVNILTASFFMLAINWRLSLIVYATLPILVATAIYFRKKVLVEYRRSC
jgi:ATP-binding cassette, subfamily B, bacterial